MTEARSVVVASDPERADISVEFVRTDDDRISATVRTRVGAERRMAGATSECAPVARAVAVSIALSLDVLAPETEPRAPRPPDRPPPPLPEPPPRRTWSLDGALGVAWTPGFISDHAAAPFLSARARLGSFALGGGIRWLLPRTLPLGSGTVDVTLLAAWIDGCIVVIGEGGHLRRSSRLDFLPCATVSAGVLRGEASGFPESARTDRPWVAAGAALLGRIHVIGPVGALVRADAVAPLVREQFVVGGLGAPYEPLPIAVALGGALEFRFWQ